MRIVEKLLRNLILFSILLSFMLSTSGFVITRHICSHHSTEIVLGEFSDDCCEMEPVKTSSCCASEKVSHCSANQEKCCQFEKTYIRLSENFVSSENNKISKEVQLFSVCSSFEILPKADELILPVINSGELIQEKIPKPKKYLLYHQVKVEPPLV